MKVQRIVSALVITTATFATACSRDVAALSPQQVESDYGVAGAHTGEVSTANGRVKGTLVPVTLADGRQGQLLIPARSRNEPHGVYLHDDQGLHPVELSPGTTRNDMQSAAPRVVSRRAEPAHPNKRSWEQEALIIGGAAGGGAGIGALAGGKKGAGIGAGVGGVGGLIYDLATRDKK